MGTGRRIKYCVMLLIVMSLIYGQQSSTTYAGESDIQKIETSTEEKQSEEKEPEDSENEGEDNPPEEVEEEPEKEIEKYDIQIPEPNGKKGYYTKKPDITICHASEVGITKYCLKKGDEKIKEGALKEKDEKVVIADELFSEGKHILHIWMENENEEKIEKYEMKREILIDTKGPQIQMSVPQGFDAWYQQQVTLNVEGDDSESGISSISCAVGGKVIGSVERKQGSFVITYPSVMQKGVEVTVTAEDKAGNKSVQIKTVYIDKEVPKVTITGAKNYMITSKSIVVTGTIDEENGLKDFDMKIIRESTEGTKKKMSVSEWKEEGTKKTVRYLLKKDGIYYIEIRATDLSGYTSTQKMQVIIDKTNPVIGYIDTLNQKYMKKFQWNYHPRDIIKDFTTYTYDVRLDGQLYPKGKSVTAEGRHKITVKAIDAAGNKAQAEAEFIIDHTAPEIIFQNIKDGEEYEEECSFQVELGKEEDIIQQIQINGEKQRIDLGLKKYEYTLHECQDYEIVVKATDRAGNEAEKRIYFQIVPKKLFIKRITEPVKKYLGAEHGQEKESSKEANAIQPTMKVPLILKIASVSTIGMILILSGYLLRKKHREKEETEEKIS